MDADGLVAQPVEHGREVVAAVAGERRQQLDGSFLGVVVAGEVQLGAVAGRDDDRLGAEVLGGRARSVEVERHALAQLDRRAVVGDADQRQRHAVHPIARRNGSADGTSCWSFSTFRNLR